MWLFVVCFDNFVINSPMRLKIILKSNSFVDFPKLLWYVCVAGKVNKYIRS